jgi:hypothetical protein
MSATTQSPFSEAYTIRVNSSASRCLTKPGWLAVLPEK